MKQVLLFLLFSTFSFSQTLVVSDDDLINTYISIENERMYLFYTDRVVDINLKDLSTKEDLYDFSNIKITDFIGVSVNFKYYFLDPQGGAVYLFENNKFKRIDTSYKHRMQIESSVFTYKNEIYKYGGYGFWSNRNFITKFNFETNQWDFVPHFNSEELPSGSHKSIVKIVEDDLYVYGGLKVNEFNPDIIENNNEIWKFNFINKVWGKLGINNLQKDNILNNTKIDYGNKSLFLDKATSSSSSIDFINNKVTTYNNSTLLNSLSPGLNSFFYKNKFFLFVKENPSDPIIVLKIRNEDEILGEIIAQKSFYGNQSVIIILMVIIGSILILIMIYKIIRGANKKRNKLSVKVKNKIKFKNKEVDLDDISYEIVKILVHNDFVLSKDILPLLKNPHIDYAHSTRIMRDTLFQINFKLKTLIKSEIDVIIIKKSDYDKRIKQYSINQKLFNKS
jgi:hypothetical protein